MNIKLDENMPDDMASLLLENAHNVTTVPEEHLSGSRDPHVLNVAASEGRILLTFDTDFADIREYPPGSHAGVVVFRLKDQRWTELESPAKELVASGVLEELQGGLAIVDKKRIRVRRAGIKENS